MHTKYYNMHLPQKTPPPSQTLSHPAREATNKRNASMHLAGFIQKNNVYAMIFVD